MSKTVLFQTVQFSISTQFSSYWRIDRTLSGATTPSQSGPESHGNEATRCIPKTSSSDCVVSYQDTCWGDLTPLQRNSRCILQLQPTGQVCVCMRCVQKLSRLKMFYNSYPMFLWHTHTHTLSLYISIYIYMYIYIDNIVCYIYK